MTGIPPTTSPPPAIADAPPPGKRRTKWALAGLLLSVAGLVSYIAFIENAFLRSTGALGFALIIAGCIVGGIAARQDRRRPIRVASFVNGLALVLYVVGLFGLTGLPKSPSFAALAAPPDFTLSNEAGQPTSLKDAYAAGPVLLVFYRGFW